VVYDATERDTFERTDAWVKEIRIKLGNSIPIIIAANKCDLSMMVKDDLIESGKVFAAKNKSDHMKVSARSGENVHQLFENLAISKNRRFTLLFLTEH